METFPYIQHIDLSDNRLTTLKPLGQLRHLLTINASGNMLPKLLNFDPPANLLYADFSSNQISDIGDLSGHKYLQRLYLDGNAIKEIQGLSELRNLRILSLNDNNIEVVSGLESLENLEHLYLMKNKLRSLAEGFEGLGNLRVLDLSLNAIESLRGLEFLTNLMTLLLVGNRIRKVNQSRHLTSLALLSDLDLCSNPVQDVKLYRLQVLFRLPQLRTLDGRNVMAEEKIKAENLFGLDLEDMKAIFKEIFPDKTFEDKRILTSALCEDESESEDEDVRFIQQYKSASVSMPRSGSAASLKSNVSRPGTEGSELSLVARRYVGELIEKAENAPSEV